MAKHSKLNSKNWKMKKKSFIGLASDDVLKVIAILLPA